MMAQVAPQECVFYLAWSGIAEPNPASTNRTEQLLAEPEVRHMIDEIVGRIKAGLREAAAKEDASAKDGDEPEPLTPQVEEALNVLGDLVALTRQGT